VLYQITEVHDVADPKKEEFKSSKDDGVFISRKMRRDADTTAKAEVEANKVAAEAAADAEDLRAYEAEVAFADKTDAEKTHLREKALAQAVDEARGNNGLDTEADRKKEAAATLAAANKKVADDAAKAAAAAKKA